MISGIFTMLRILSIGVIKPPFFIQMIYGILGGAGADLDNLNHMHNVADRLFGDDYEWSSACGGTASDEFLHLGGDAWWQCPRRA